MSREHETLLDHVRSAIASQASVIRELADELVDYGLDEESRRLRECASELERDGHPMDQVRCIVPILRSIAARLGELGLNKPELRLADKLRACAIALARRHDRVLTETQPIDEEDKPT